MVIEDGVHHAADRPHDRHRPVRHCDLLHESAWLEQARMLPVAISLWGTHALGPTVAFMGWFGPRGLASIVFAVMVEDAHLAHAPTVVAAIYLSVGLSVLVHGLSAAPLVSRYANWYKPPPTSPPPRWTANRRTSTEPAGPPRCRAAHRGPPSASPVLMEFAATRAVRSQRRCMGPQAHGRPRRRSSVSVLKQMEASVLEPFLGTKPVRKPGAPRRRGPVADAGRQRHDARPVPRDRHRRPQARLLLPPALGREGLGSHRRHET